MSTILALAANPRDTVQLRLQEEIREISDRLRIAGASGLSIVQEGAVRSQDLLRHLMRHSPDIVHFSGHGTEQGEVVLEDDAGGSRPVAPQTLQRVFKQLKGNIRCVVLNSCYSEPQAEAIASSIDCVVGMSSAVYDRAAIAFAASFYQALGFGQSIQAAFELGCLEVSLLGVPGEDTPRMHTADGVNAANVFLTARPELWCEFPLSNGKPYENDDGYEIRLFVKNAPSDTLSVVYQLNHETFRDDGEEFLEVPNDSREGFEAFIGSVGDFEIRATVWQSRTGYGLNLARCRARTLKPAWTYRTVRSEMTGDG